MFIQGSCEYELYNGLKDTIFLFAIVVISTESDYHVIISSTRKDIFLSLTVTFGGTKATLTISEGSHGILRRFAKS
jgi:hypothetical protein